MLRNNKTPIPPCLEIILLDTNKIKNIDRYDGSDKGLLRNWGLKSMWFLKKGRVQRVSVKCEWRENDVFKIQDILKICYRYVTNGR